jgi:histidine triad (HIT) family protein
MSDCLFCKIVAGEIPVQRLLEDDASLAFPDINPQAPTHALVVPKKHIASLTDVQGEDWALIGRMYQTAVKLAGQKGLTAPGAGFRTVFNYGPQAGQSVFHLHLHVLGGRGMHWPPG